MPIDLVAPTPVTMPVRLVDRPTLALLGNLVVVLLLTCVWVGIQGELAGSLPSDAQETIAGP